MHIGDPKEVEVAGRMVPQAGAHGLASRPLADVVAATE